MGNTLIFYEDANEGKKTATTLAHILVNTKCLSLDKMQRTMAPYKSVIIVGTYELVHKYVNTLIDMLNESKQIKNLLFLLLAPYEKENEKLISQVRQAVPGVTISSFTIDKEEKCYEVASQIADLLGRPEKEMPRELLKEELISILQQHNTCALATGYGEYVRCTPIEYTYKDGQVYLITEGGRKFISMQQNPRVCIAIFDSFTSMSNIKGLQIMGRAEVVPYETEEYLMVFKEKKITKETLAALPITMNVIRITPERCEILSSSFRKLGYDTKQYYEGGL